MFNKSHKGMTLQECYNAIVNVTRETGQGVSKKLTFFRLPYPQYADHIKFLLDEGHISSYHEAGDEWFYPVGDYYKFWEHQEGRYDTQKLTYTRMYLGIGISFKPLEEVMNRPEVQADYQKWVSANEPELKKLKNLQTKIIDESSLVDNTTLSSDEIANIKTYKFYKGNRDIPYVRNLIADVLHTNKALIDLYNSKLKLVENKIPSVATEKEIKTLMNEISELVIENKLLLKVNVLLTGINTGNIQEHIK